jgi:predicted N-acetyltransferase YhbS
VQPFRSVFQGVACKKDLGQKKDPMQQSAITLAPETAHDRWEVEALYDLCFAPGRSALSSYRLREGVDPIADLCLTARDNDGILAGAVRNWPVRIGDHGVVLLGPIAVHPTRQGEGVAALLMQECLERAKAAGSPRIMLVGDAPYYERFGFEILNDAVMPPPTNPQRVLGMALQDGAWDGVAGPVVRARD